MVYANNTPANGGTLLGSFVFNSPLADGMLGGSFATPISLTGGDTYFIGFENVGPMGEGLAENNVDDLGVCETVATGSAAVLGEPTGLSAVMARRRFCMSCPVN